MFVASSRPPNPTSMTAALTLFLAKARSPSVVVISKVVSLGIFVTAGLILHQLDQLLVRNRLAIDLNPFGVIPQMWRGI